MEDVITLDKNGLGHLWGRIKQLVENLVGGVERYPVGSIYLSVNNVNPSKYFGGTWVAWGAGRVPVGVDTTQTEFNAVQKTGGEKTHTLTVEQMPHVSGSIIMHGQAECTVIHQASGCFSSARNNNAYASQSSLKTSGATSVGVINMDNGGKNQTHNNLQPYITCYMWRRTA